MTVADKNVVRKEVKINASQKHTFETFTKAFDGWWPRSHHIGKAEMKRAVMEGKENGRWYEIGVDGSECDWGKVLVWDPYKKLLLAWQLTAAWQYDPNFVTEVEVKFIELGPNLTQLVLEHRNIDRFGDKAPQVWRALDSEGGWTGLVAMFAKLAENPNHNTSEKSAAV